MNKKLTPHIIAVTALVVFIVLGLACASSSKENLFPMIPLPTLSELREKNGENNKLVVIFNRNKTYFGGDHYLDGKIVIDSSSIQTMRSYQQEMKALDSENRANFAGNLFAKLRDGVFIESSYRIGREFLTGRPLPCYDVAAFSLGNNVSEIGIFLYKKESAGGYSQPVTFYVFLYIPISDKKEQFYSIESESFIEITDESTVIDLLSRGAPHSYVPRGPNERPQEFIRLPIPGNEEDEKEKELKNAINAKPKNAKAYYDLGDYYYWKVGKYVLAAKVWEKTLELNPNYRVKEIYQWSPQVASRYGVKTSKNIEFTDFSLNYRLANAHISSTTSTSTNPDSAVADNDKQSSLEKALALYRKGYDIDITGRKSANANLKQVYLGFIGYTLDRLGRTDEANSVYKELAKVATVTDEIRKRIE